MMHNSNSQGHFESDKKSSSSGYCFTFIGFVICIIMSIAIFIYGIFIYYQVSEYDHSIEELVSNWKSYPIVDIKTSPNECPAGYETLIRGGWPGTVEGCICTSTWNPLLSNFTRGSCSSIDIKNGCSKVLPQSYIGCSKFYSNNICGLRQGLNFVDTKRPSGPGLNSTCPTGFRLCGKGDSNTNYCVKADGKCPITDVYIGNGNGTIKLGYSVAPLSDGRYIGFTDSFSALPVVDFKITEGKVCVDQEQQMKSEGREIYKLMNETYGECTTKVSGNSTDPEYIMIDNIKENRFFNDNNVTKVIQSLPNYNQNDSAKYDWNLFYTRYYPWNIDCERKSNIDRLELTKLIDNSDDISSLQWKTLLLICLQAIICSFILEILGIFIACCCNGLKHTYQIIWLMIKLVTCGIILYYICKCIKLAGVYKSSIQTIMDTDCSSLYVNSMLDAYGNSQLGSKGHNIILGILVIVAALISVIFVIIEMRKKE